MKRRLLFLLAGLILIPVLNIKNQSYGEDWALLKEGKGVASIYVDQDSYKDINGLRYFWLKSIMAYPKRRRKRDQTREVRLYHALDCQSKEVYPPVQMKKYRGDGKLLDEIHQDFDNVKSGKRSVLEISAGKKVYKSVCEHLSKR